MHAGKKQVYGYVSSCSDRSASGPSRSSVSWGLRRLPHGPQHGALLG